MSLPEHTRAPVGGTPSQSAANPPAPEPKGKAYLLDAFDKLVDHEEKKRHVVIAGIPLWRVVLPVAMALVLSAGAGYVWLAKPTWLYPEVAPPAPITTAKRAQRYLEVTAHLIEEFWHSAGRLPTSLAELNVLVPGMTMTALGPNRYRLDVSGSGIGFALEGQVDSIPVLTETRR